MKNLKETIREIDINSFCFETLFKFCPDGIVCKDENLCYLGANDSYKATFTLTNFETIVGKKNNPYIPLNIMKLIQEADKEVRQSCSFINYVINISSDKLLNVTTFPIIYKKAFLGLISIVKDITQEEALKEDFVNKHYEHIDAERKLQSQREAFVASLGHDLKNPTIAQIRSLELLLKGSFGSISDTQKELLEMILDSCRYMNGMLSSLLATYRNYGGVIKLNFAEFSFVDLVNECVSEMIYVAKDKGVNIVLNDEMRINIVSADRVQIKRVIMNLLSNGIKYAYPNSVLTLLTCNYKNLVSFEFENESPYIPEEKQKAIFAQYVSYASAHNELGIGLGLYASKKIIDGHQGKIFVKSYLDNRNTFGFKIPIKQNNCDENVIYF